MRESADSKSARLLVERRVTILKADTRGVWAHVRGDSATYHAKWTRAPGSLLVGECDCAAFGQTCSHLLALRRVWTGEKR